MAYTRLSQYGIGVQAYETPVDVDLSTANWGWTAYPVTVDYEPASLSRLGQFAVVQAQYPAPSSSETVFLTQQNWGWTAYNITIPGENFYLPQQDWGYKPFNPTICSQDPSGYAYSFNSYVWPSCVYNDFKYGPRTATEIDLAGADWGWQSLPVTVDFQDPVDVGLTLANWGWTNLPVAVSYGTDIALQISAWGWQPLNITVELPYDVDLSADNWGWTALPVGVSYAYDVGLTIASYGWQAFPLTVDVPSFDIDLRKTDWGWQSFPMEVKQTTLSQGDIDAIAQAVYDKLATEGMVQQVLETWQREGCDSNYPQDIPVGVGKYITVGTMQIYVERLPDGTIRQTRQ